MHASQLSNVKIGNEKSKAERCQTGRGEGSCTDDGSRKGVGCSCCSGTRGEHSTEPGEDEVGGGERDDEHGNGGQDGGTATGARAKLDRLETVPIDCLEHQLFGGGRRLAARPLRWRQHFLRWQFCFLSLSLPSLSN